MCSTRAVIAGERKQRKCQAAGGRENTHKRVHTHTHKTTQAADTHKMPHGVSIVLACGDIWRRRWMDEGEKKRKEGGRVLPG